MQLLLGRDNSAIRCSNRSHSIYQHVGNNSLCKLSFLPRWQLKKVGVMAIGFWEPGGKLRRVWEVFRKYGQTLSYYGRKRWTWRRQWDFAQGWSQHVFLSWVVVEMGNMQGLYDIKPQEIKPCQLCCLQNSGFKEIYVLEISLSLLTFYLGNEHSMLQ